MIFDFFSDPPSPGCNKYTSHFQPLLYNNILASKNTPSTWGYYMQLFLFHGSVNCYHLEEHFMDDVGEVEFWHP